MDYFGPIQYKGKDGSMKKLYGALFGCLTYRAIHIELVKDLSAEKCLEALRKFFSFRGRPETILSDNAANFKAAFRALQCAGGTSVIKWLWTTELAPWTGGTHERLVALVKRCLRSTVGKRRLPFSEWEILAKEVSRVVNSRPLSSMSEYEIIKPLRPLDLLEPWGDQHQMEFQFPNEDEGDPDYAPTQTLSGNLARAFTRNNKLFNTFQEIFYEQYLLALRERHETGEPSLGSNPKVGDIVLLQEERKVQILWRLGQIVELLKSKDGRHRSALVRVYCRDSKKNLLLKRAIKSLYPLMQPSQTSPLEGPAHIERSSSEPSDNEQSPNQTDDEAERPSSSHTPMPLRQRKLPSRLELYHLYQATASLSNCLLLSSKRC
jgi:hypothetical protein